MKLTTEFHANEYFRENIKLFWKIFMYIFRNFNKNFGVHFTESESKFDELFKRRDE